MKKLSVPIIVSALLLLAMLLFVRFEEQVSADAITNYQGRLTLETASAHTTTASDLDWETSTIDVVGYGSVMWQITQDVPASETVTYTMKYSVDPVACSSAANWFIGKDYFFYLDGDADAYRYLNYSTYPTGTNPVTTTYIYSTAAAVAGTPYRGYVNHTFTIAGDGTAGYHFPTNGAWCAKIYANTVQSKTITTTVYAAPVDIYK